MQAEFRHEIEHARLEHHRLVDALLDEEIDALERLAEACSAVLDGGGTLLFFGNGGSAAQAQELAGEFVNRYSQKRRALSALALTANTSVLTSVGNDLNFSEIYSRQIEALGRRGDLAIGISTSGASENVVHGLRTARGLGLRSAALVGHSGGLVGEAADLVVRVPGRDTARIQEVQMFAGHLLCRWVEHLLGMDPSTRSTGSGQASSGRGSEQDRSLKVPVKLPAES